MVRSVVKSEILVILRMSVEMSVRRSFSVEITDQEGCEIRNLDRVL